MSLNISGNWLLYDGDCPFCRNYIHMVHIRKLKDLQLINAREFPDFVNAQRMQSREINKGMILHLDNEIYFGKDAMFVLSSLGSDNALLNFFLKVFFLSPKRSSIFYPFCVWMRDTALFFLRIKQI